MHTLFNQKNNAVPHMARAIVRANNDPEKKGRVQVEYPWLDKNSAQVPSEWARVCSVYASKESGMWFLPEVDDEVIVFFENGNIDYPIIMGTLYSPKNQPPTSQRNGDLNDDNKNNLKFIKSRSGNLLCFDDSDDKAGVVLKDKDNRRIEIQSKDDKIIVSDQQGNGVTINGNKINVNNSSGNGVTIEGSKIAVKNSSNSHVTIDGSKITIESGGKIELGEGAAAKLVKGDEFLNLFNAHTHIVGPSTSSSPTVPIQPTAVLSQKVSTV